MKKNLFTKILVVYVFTFLIIGGIFFFLLPTLLNYPPDSINNDFQRSVDSGLLYSEQYILIITLCFVVSVFSIKLSTKKIDKLNLASLKEFNQKYIKSVRALFNLPYKIFLMHITAPTLIIILLYAISEGSVNIGTLKIALVILIINTLVALSLIIYCKNLISKLLNKFCIDKNYMSHFASLKSQIIIVILPMILVALVFSSLLGYSQLVLEKGSYMYYSNKLLLDNTFYKSNYTLAEIKKNLSTMELLEEKNDIFIIFSESNYTTLNNTNLSDFFIKYTLYESGNQNGRTYDTYGIDTQGVTKKIYIDGFPVYIGICYDITNKSTVLNLFWGISILFIINFFVLYYIAKSLSDGTKQVARALYSIAHKNLSSYDVILPITSNDEIAALTIAFNDIQQMTKDNIKQIEENQGMLMEKERLASLGQMIGGIAHNLKTPIMSISGAAEGLKDLTKEYDISIGDPTVTNEDHHAIVKDMNSWIEKIQTHTSYMSDVITAVKGQAVAFTESTADSFTLKELLTYVDVLMKHELKNALIELNTKLLVPDTLSIKGNINSLVQVLNNIISNAIQAYNGKTNKNIDFIINKNKNNIVFTIQDYGSGIPEKIQTKLFNEMITTKGKNGTGLGLFMSYSNIRAHFNGNMTFESEEGKGTKFIITIPMN